MKRIPSAPTTRLLLVLVLPPLTLPFASSATAQRTPIHPEAMLRDPPRDSIAPASGASMRIVVNGARIYGLLAIAAGAGPHPTLLMLHGFPGYQGLSDVAESLRRAGVNVLSMHYRGAWGSEGTFTFGGAVDDAAAAVAWLKETARANRVDTTRMYVLGHSFGGFVAMRLAARTHDIKGVAYVSGWDIVADAEPWLDHPTPAHVSQFIGDSNAYGNTAALMQEVMDHRKDYPLATIAAQVADRPILMTYATHEEEDDAPSRNYRPLREALRATGAARVETRVFNTDHGYSDARIALARAVAEWLARIDRPVP